jgi:hypothetical protein
VHGVRLKLSSSSSSGTDKNGSFLPLARYLDSVHFPSSLSPSRELEETELLVLINTALPQEAQWGISEMKQTDLSRFNILQVLLVGTCVWSWTGKLSGVCHVTSDR